MRSAEKMETLTVLLGIEKVKALGITNLVAEEGLKYVLSLADTMEEIHEAKNFMKFSFQHVLR